MTKGVELSKYKVGLGFGGDNQFDRFRIWIDGLDLDKSYVLQEDETYEHGVLGASY